MNTELKDTRVAILATNGFEQSELMKPRQALQDAGATVHVVSPEKGSIKGWDEKDWGESVPVDKTLGDANAADYDMLVLPGGQINPDLLRVDEDALGFIRQFDQAGKPIAAICHALWLLAETGIARGRRLTSYKSIQTDMKNAGATWVDEEVVVDGTLITSRNPGDIPAFNEAIVNKLKERTPEMA